MGDVLLGRGRGYANHPGNIRFQSLVDEHADDYNATTSRFHKSRIVHKVVSGLQRSGRFLKYIEELEGWFEVDLETARVKASQALRYRFRRASTAGVSDAPIMPPETTSSAHPLAFTEIAPDAAASAGTHPPSPRKERESFDCSSSEDDDPLLSDQAILNALGYRLEEKRVVPLAPAESDTADLKLPARSVSDNPSTSSGVAGNSEQGSGYNSDTEHSIPLDEIGDSERIMDDPVELKAFRPDEESDR